MDQSLDDPGFKDLLEYLRDTRGFDFTGYKPASVQRRAQRRAQDVGAADFGEYRDYLEVHPEEFVQLFNTILINVTGFFRDRPAWDHLAAEIVPGILAERGSKGSLRVWSAACASGEEAYSLAMILAEALGEKAFHERVKIYATDVDEEALLHARQATYGTREMEAVPEPLREKYFGPVGGSFVFRSEMRRAVIFGRNDLVQDAPISRLDLLACRNALMYFNSETQAKILRRFHFALREKGVLFLGRAEMLLSHANLFTPLDLKHRLFSKAPGSGERERTMALANGPMLESNPDAESRPPLESLAYELGSAASVVVDRDGKLALANDSARNLFGLDLRDIGRLFCDLELSYRPAELRSVIDRVRSENRAAVLGDVERRLSSGEVQHLQVEVKPLQDERGAFLGVAIYFRDETRANQLEVELARSNQERETASEELQSTNEELETTNEELQSTVEELQTTNEELQATNEEMETMNEELQATNEEMHATNDEMRERTSELNRVNGFLNSILGGLTVGVAVVDSDLKVLLWNERARDMWGLRAEEVRGRSLGTLDIGLPAAALEDSVRAFMRGNPPHEPLVVDAVNRKGRAVKCRLRYSELALEPNSHLGGVVVLMEGEPADGQ